MYNCIMENNVPVIISCDIKTYVFMFKQRDICIYVGHVIACFHVCHAALHVRICVMLRYFFLRVHHCK